MIIHKIAHLLNWNYGTPRTWWDGNRLMVAFKCEKCGKLEGSHDITEKVNKDIEAFIEEKERGFRE